LLSEPSGRLKQFAFKSTDLASDWRKITRPASSRLAAPPEKLDMAVARLNTGCQP
jgi:hypothetical protein